MKDQAHNGIDRLKNSGQAIIEFIMMMAAAIAMALLLGAGFQKSAGGLWKSIFCEVSAPCPSCSAPDQVKRASIGGKCL